MPFAPSAFASFSLFFAAADDSHFCPHCHGQFHRHMAQTTEPDHANAAAWANIPGSQRGESGDTGTKNRRSLRQIHIIRYTQYKLFPHNDMFGVATLSDLAAYAIRTSVGQGHPVTTELFFTMLTLIAVHAAIHHATDGNTIAHMIFLDVLSC